MKLIIPLGIIVTMMLAPLGLLLASKATLGVSIIAFACSCGIVTRILQAESNHAETMRRK